ncbi:hypothetical protein OUZ56_026709 [Daphnia magna]|uniref:Uncharacterized protein n=1 Tax=Daphnia magna TaxID=35525 RepID=A0ABQ9ZMK1_9CRUS|nr:hypothetical protein OUZ56_026709 [Daphnia magna]
MVLLIVVGKRSWSFFAGSYDVNRDGNRFKKTLPLETPLPLASSKPGFDCFTMRLSSVCQRESVGQVGSGPAQALAPAPTSATVDHRVRCVAHQWTRQYYSLARGEESQRAQYEHRSASLLSLDRTVIIWSSSLLLDSIVAGRRRKGRDEARRKGDADTTADIKEAQEEAAEDEKESRKSLHLSKNNQLTTTNSALVHETMDGSNGRIRLVTLSAATPSGITTSARCVDYGADYWWSSRHCASLSGLN